MTKPLTTSHLLLAIALAVFLLSCSEHERDNPNDPDGINFVGYSSSDSSSSEEDSSSSLEYVSSSSSEQGSSSSEMALSSSDAGSSSSEALTSSSSGEQGSSNSEEALSSSDAGSSSVTSSSSAVVMESCGANTYNPETQFCQGGNTVTQLCDNKTFSGSQFCSIKDNKVYDKCNGDEYNTDDHICCNNLQQDKYTLGCCRNQLYTLSSHFCYNNTILGKCDGTGDTYIPGTEECCGSKAYNLATQFCNNNIVVNKCGGSEYDPGTEQCCGNSTYSPTTHFCYDNSKIGSYCETRTEIFDPDKYECTEGKIYLIDGFEDSRDNKTYKAVLIGTQTWMAENLNHAAAGSRCNNVSINDEENSIVCEFYGRLYNWTTAMSVCPSGWHLPSNAEWNVLIKFVNPNCLDNTNCADAGTKLKSKGVFWTLGGGNGVAGTDDYGFSALPGGYGNSNGTFSSLSYDGYWWSASEDANGDNAYYRYMRNSGNSEYVFWSNYTKDRLLSVRCVRD
jgi:uncharacterized protein (TIGR02145 family)